MIPTRYPHCPGLGGKRTNCFWACAIESRPSCDIVRAMAIDRQVALVSVLAILALSACKRERVQPPKPATYANNSCGGQPSWSVFGSEDGELMTYNHLAITPSATLWNSLPISLATLDDYLVQVSALNPRPVTALVPNPRTSCADVEAVRRMMEDRLHCSGEMGCVEYSERDWAKRHPHIP